MSADVYASARGAAGTLALSPESTQLRVAIGEGKELDVAKDAYVDAFDVVAQKWVIGKVIGHKIRRCGTSVVWGRALPFVFSLSGRSSRVVGGGRRIVQGHGMWLFAGISVLDACGCVLAHIPAWGVCVFLATALSTRSSLRLRMAPSCRFRRNTAFSRSSGPGSTRNFTTTRRCGTCHGK